jgi:predicted RNA methylase
MEILKLIKLLDAGLPAEIDAIFNSAENLTINKLQKLKAEKPQFPWSELITQKELRQRAKAKFDDPANMLFTRKGLEQSSSEVLANYHYMKCQNAVTIADLCCGIGSDLRLIAIDKEMVYALDLDDVTLQCAQYNCRHLPQITFIREPAENFTQKVDFIFADPDRRIDNRRSIDPETMSPTLSFLLSLFFEKKLSAKMLIKLAPALDYKAVEREYFLQNAKYQNAPYHWEFISENGVLKEILLCLGFSDNSDSRKAVLLPQSLQISGSGNEHIALSDWQKYIFEPDNAVIRSGLVQKLGLELGYQLIDNHIALLTGKTAVSQDFGKLYRVIEVFPWNIKFLRKYLRDRDIGVLIIKTRGFPQSSEKILQQFKLKGTGKMTIIITRIGSSHQVAVLELF